MIAAAMLSHTCGPVDQKEYDERDNPANDGPNDEADDYA